MMDVATSSVMDALHKAVHIKVVPRQRGDTWGEG